MRILHISKFAYPERGGIETFVQDLSAEQASQGHRICILCHHPKAGVPADDRIVGDLRIIRAAISCKLSFAPIAPGFPFLLHRILSEFKPDILHLHLPNPAVLFVPFLTNIPPLIVSWHADVQGQPNRMINRLYPGYRFFENRCLAKASRIIATSPAYRESSPTLAKWRDKCLVVPLGLDMDRYPPSHGAGKDIPPLVLSVGRFTYYKGYEYLVRAARLIPDAHFVIVGDGPDLPGIKALVNRLHLADRVKLPGAVTDRDLQTLFQRASIFCLPSVDRGEAFGMVQLEAMRYGLPIVSTAIPGSGVDWVNQDGVTGLIVPPASPEALARAIEGLLQREDKGAALGRAGQRRLDDNFTIKRVADALNAVYAETAA